MAAAAVGGAAAVSTLKANAKPLPSDAESRLLGVIQQIERQQLDAALQAAAKLTADVKKALDMPETRQRADAAGIELRYLPPDALGELVKTETAYWAKTIKAAGIKAD